MEVRGIKKGGGTFAKCSVSAYVCERSVAACVCVCVLQRSARPHHSHCIDV